jgi:hypothetical protein
MALIDLMSELRGAVPKVPITYCKTLVNRAYKEIREANLWGFQLTDFAWVTPPPILAGTVTTTQGSPNLVFDATAQTALATASTLYSLLTVRQFRVLPGGVYNIISYDGAGNMVLDRPFMDVGGAGQSYTVYQAYYTPPMIDFLTLLSVRNTSMFLDLDLTHTRAEIDAMDPQRSWYQFPTCVVPFEIDARSGSSTLGWQMYELWGQAITPFTYQCYGIRRGTDLVAPTDTLPQAIGDDLVLAKARNLAYEWAEANKDMSPRSSGPDFRFLMAKADDDYKKLLIKYRKQDKEFVNNWLTARGLALAGRWLGAYNTVVGVAAPYTQ